MSTQFNIEINTNIERPIAPTRRGIIFYRGDDRSHKITVKVNRDGVPQALSGSIKGYAHRDNGTVLTIDGSIVDGNAQLILRKEVYEVQGQTEVIIKNKNGNIETTIADLRAYTNDYIPNDEIETETNIDFIDSFNAYMDGETLVVETGNA